MKYPSFFAKILLFGEYGIIENAKGLTIPCNFYKGTMKFGNSEKANQSNTHLKNYWKYLNEHMSAILDVDKFKQDIAQNLYFDSDIPQGYGVGSSGALVAAIYDEYALNKKSKEELNKKDIAELKRIFGVMESYFHGKSSGIDPLICYMNIPLLIHSEDDIDKVGIPNLASEQGKGAVFLINSGAPGETGPMVRIFFEKLKNEGFRQTLHKEFTKYNDACIDSFVKGEYAPLFSNLKKLSTWAFVHFRPMIPKRLLQAWEHGIQTNNYYLKLCGSGGGGYILGFTKDFEKTQDALKDFELQPIYRF